MVKIGADLLKICLKQNNYHFTLNPKSSDYDDEVIWKENKSAYRHSQGRVILVYDGR
jgi:hypothetical protein